MMNKLLKLTTLLCVSSMLVPVPLMAKHPGYPDIPSTRTKAMPHKMIMEARVRPQRTRTDGYHVTDPYGNSYYVDNVIKPKCAFYANYINTDSSALNRAGRVNQPKISSKAYIGKVTIKGCN
ncbi:MULTISPECIES: hypothetical protein [Neisseria]|uniref:hypothetical protein n=1 Tax=Neisseria TaxID=482 RepID=UPI000F794331|nr:MULTISPECIES: hypothetical protein [Neisseria]UOO85184.1 hypothetical protein LVJ88_04165 [Neisseria dumasiana]